VRFRDAVSGSQDQLVHVCQAKPIDATLMVNLDFALLSEQLFALDPQNARSGGGL
jgi:hypothetical protein